MIEFQPSGPQDEPRPPAADIKLVDWLAGLVTWLKRLASVRRRDLERLADELQSVPQETIAEASVPSGGSVVVGHDRGTSPPWVSITPLEDVGTASLWVSVRDAESVTISAGALPGASALVLVRISS